MEMDKTFRTSLSALLMASLAGGLLCGCQRSAAPAKPSPAPQAQKSETSTPPPPDGKRLSSALAVANEFCEAWRGENFPAARELLSLRMRRRHSEKSLYNALVPPLGGSHKAYLLSGGAELDDGRVRFDAKLFYEYPGQRDDRLEAALVRIILATDSDDAWKVDEFPVP